MIRRECSWCKAKGRLTVLPAQPGDENEPDAVSHGICPSCADEAWGPVRIQIQAGAWKITRPGMASCGPDPERESDDAT